MIGDGRDPQAGLDLEELSPTAVPDRLRLLSQFAAERGADPVTALDDLNLLAPREWLIVATGLAQAAAAIERRFAELVEGRTGGCPGAANAAECGNFACRRHGCQGG